MDKKYSYSEIFETMRKIVPPSVKIFLVGGAVRDILLNIAVKDYDFAVEGLVRPIGKKLADAFGGSYYVLDDERDMVRVLLNQDGKDCFCIDIAQICDSGLEADLKARDFTINAIAFDFIDKHAILDPLMGVTDLKEKRLRMCSPDSLEKDPVRALRSIRLALEYDLCMDEELISALKTVIPLYPTCSMERYRDELFKIIAVGKNASSIQLLERFDFLQFFFPGSEASDLQPLISRLRGLDHLIRILTCGFDEEASSNIISGTAVLELGAFREQLIKHFDDSERLVHERRSLLVFTALAGGYGFSAKTISKDGIRKRGKQVILSSDELKLCGDSLSACEALKKTDPSMPLADLEIHRFFLKFGESAIDGFLLYLADVLLDLQNDPSDLSGWKKALIRTKSYFDAWFNRYQEVIKPVKLISGSELCAALNIPAGPKVGALKKAITEAQVEKKISTTEEAVAFAKRALAEIDGYINE